MKDGSTQNTDNGEKVGKKRKLSDVDNFESEPGFPKFTRVDNEATVMAQRVQAAEVEMVLEGSPHEEDDMEVDESEGGVTLDGLEDEEATTHDSSRAVEDKKAARKAAARQAKSERRSRKRENMQTVKDRTPGTVQDSTPLVADDLNPNNQDPTPPTTQDSRPTTLSQPESKQRFIVFIGNLPYSATATSISTHFSKLLPFTVRHSTVKSTGRSRGFAFLEFESYDRMKTCLKAYHHSMFEAAEVEDGNPGGGENGKKSQARRINVELTAGGGGGKSGVRKEKIRGKNEKLGEERERARVQKAKEEAKEKRKKDKAEEKTGANAVELTNGGDEENIHPSRRKRVKR